MYASENARVTVTAWVNEMTIKQFAKIFSSDVVVLEPRAIADAVREDAWRTVEIYEEMRDQKNA